jgi:hypothetical protein
VIEFRSAKWRAIFFKGKLQVLIHLRWAIINGVGVSNELGVRRTRMNEIMETDRTQIRQTIFRNRLSDLDSSEIKQAILRHYNFKHSLTWRTDRENTIYLLENRLSPEHFPRRKRIKFAVVTQQRIDEMQQKKGIEFYQFEKLDVLRKTPDSFVAGKYCAILDRKFFGRLPKHNNLQQERNGSFAVYQCEKILDKWRIRKISYRCWTQL